MPYAVINKTGCGIHKNRIKLRLDFFLNNDDPNYLRTRLYVVDTTSDEYQSGYKGKRNEDGSPVDAQDYQAWLDSLPHVWIDASFHTHFIYPNASVSDDELKIEIERCLSYFYAFHQHCWNNELRFIDEWKKVSSTSGEIRCPFVKGDIKDKATNEVKVQNIIARIQDFEVAISEVATQKLNIGKKGTIDVGSPAIDRGSASNLATNTIIDYNNPANADGVIDTVDVYVDTYASGNVFRVGSFVHNGSYNFTCHDGIQIGEITQTGLSHFTGLSLDILAGERIGADGNSSGKDIGVDRDTTGGNGMCYLSGAYCDPEDNATFSFLPGDILSLYGTGTEGGAPSHRKSSFFTMF